MTGAVVAGAAATGGGGGDGGGGGEAAAGAAAAAAEQHTKAVASQALRGFLLAAGGLACPLTWARSHATAELGTELATHQRFLGQMALAQSAVTPEDAHLLRYRTRQMACGTASCRPASRQGWYTAKKPLAHSH